MTEAQIAIPPSDYLTGDRPGNVRPRTRIHVAIEPNGMTRITQGERDRGEDLVGFVPLGSGRHFFIMWVAKLDGQEAPPNETVYTLLEALPAGRYRLYLPDCDYDHDRPVAVAAGGYPTADHRPSCRFPDRASLEAAFAAYARQHREGMDIIPARPR